MGAAQSSNVANATTQITDYVQNSAEVDNSQIQNIEQNINLKGCEIIASGNVNITSLATTVAENHQLNQALNNTSINNQIQQKMLQAASSTVGSMGVGYADASNSASMYANSSSTIVNTTKNVSEQVANIDQNFTCEGSYIKGRNITIALDTDSHDISEQILKAQDVNDIVNQVSQSIEQKATAKVEGLVGFILALAVLLGSLGYAVAKPLSSGSMKIVMVVIVLLVVGGLMAFMYIKKTPPFFSDNNVCNPHSNLGGNCSSNCINQTKQTISIDGAPLRYTLALPGGQQGAGTTGDLLGTAIAGVVNSINSGKPVDNQGYNMLAKTQVENRLSSIVNSLEKSCPDAIPNEPLPELMINPYTDDSQKGYGIPPQYKYGAGDGSCTPSSIQVKGSFTPREGLKNCPTIVSSNTPGVNLVDISDTPEQVIANINDDAWKQYCTDPSIPLEELKKRQMFARFVLGRLSSPDMDMTVYTDPNEIISYLDSNGNTVYSIASADPNNSYHFQPSGSAFSMLDSNMSGGKVVGIFGVCNDRTYKLHQIGIKAGSPIFAVFVLGVILYIFFGSGRKSNPINSVKK